MQNEQLIIQNKLRGELLDKQVRNPNYSMRSFAQKIDLNPGTVSAILNGKRNVSKEVANKILKGLAIDPQERSEILSLFPDKRKYKKESNQSQIEDQENFHKLHADTFKVLANDDHMVFLSLVNCFDFKSDYEWISKKMGISVLEVSNVVKRLVNINLIRVDDNGDIHRTFEKVRTSDDIENMLVKKRHDISLEKARKSLFEDDIKIRDLSSITMAIDSSKLDEAKSLIRKFQDDLADLLEAGTQDEVYRFSTQLIPLTKKLNTNGGE